MSEIQTSQKKTKIMKIIRGVKHFHKRAAHWEPMFLTCTYINMHMPKSGKSPYWTINTRWGVENPK
jgi:hypothetical protein